MGCFILGDLENKRIPYKDRLWHLSRDNMIDGIINNYLCNKLEWPYMIKREPVWTLVITWQTTSNVVCTLLLSKHINCSSLVQCTYRSVLLTNFEMSQTCLWVMPLAKFLGGQDVTFLSHGIVWRVHHWRESLGEWVVPHRVFSLVVLGCVLVAQPVLYVPFSK